MPDQKRYTDFSVADLISDEYFQDWVLHPEEENDTFWQTWLLKNPDQQNKVKEARLLLSRIGFHRDLPAEGNAEMALAKAWEQIDARQPQRGKYIVFANFLRQNWKMTAIWILLTATVLFTYNYSNSPKNTVVSTRFGQLDSINLPDQSQVILNAHSTLSYTWKNDAPREVWLDGEAFFNVAHLDKDNKIQPSERFLVHVGRITVEVLGTSFNIRKRRSMIEIALLKGSIKVHIVNSSSADIIMKPGELLSLDTVSNRIASSVTNTSNNAAWTQKRLVLNNPTVQEICAYLEDIYGKKILLASPALATRKVEGPILLDSLEDALFVLSTVLNVEIESRNNTLIVRQR